MNISILFLDANGRTGRLLIKEILMNHGYFPLIIYATNSRAYYNAIVNGLHKKIKKKYYQFMVEQGKKTYDYISVMMRKY